MKNIFDRQVTNEIIGRINALEPSRQALWGSMSVSQMLAHCNVSYEMVYENKHPKPNAFMKFIFKTFVKRLVTNEAPFKKSEKTAPQFIIGDKKNFDQEKQRLIGYINRTQELGEGYFDGRESHSFGKLNKNEWNNMFYKHLDHHLRQFGV